ncbi:MAG: rhodanese-like domain-containing protein, partial [Candidatus Fonsibacter sp.]
GKKYPESKFSCSKDLKLLKIKAAIKKNIEDKAFNLIDARSSGRFNGNEPEPRPDIKSGSIPNSLNLPWSECIDQNTKCFLNSEILKKKFENLKISNSSEVVFSCGSGVTACILAKA